MSGGAKPVTPAKGVIARTVKAAQGTGDAKFAEVGFEAMLRKLDRDDRSYRE